MVVRHIPIDPAGWPLEFDERFDGYDNLLQSIYIQPAVAYDFQALASIVPR